MINHKSPRKNKMVTEAPTDQNGGNTDDDSAPISSKERISASSQTDATVNVSDSKEAQKNKKCMTGQDQWHLTAYRIILQNSGTILTI